jgi:hypothetical protein
MKTILKTTSKTAILQPTLRWSPTAWAKLLFLRDAGETEIGGFGISAADDLLLIEDIVLVSQSATWAHVAFNDEAIADFFDRQVAAGRKPEAFGRIWVHTHSGKSAVPSGTDEATFTRVFGRSNWAIMFILARGGQTYARLRYNTGPGADFLLPVEVDFSCPFTGTDISAWDHEYASAVQIQDAAVEPILAPLTKRHEYFLDDEWPADWNDGFEFTPQECEHGYIRDF